MLFAATYPERVQALVLDASFARATAAPDYPEGAEQQRVFEAMRETFDHAWGEGKSISFFAPSVRIFRLRGNSWPSWNAQPPVLGWQARRGTG